MRNSSGFTVLELMIVIAIVAVLSAIGIPNYISWLPKRHLQSSATDVQAAINLAKMTAIKENTDVELAFDLNNESYTITYTDQDRDGNNFLRTIRDKQMNPGINLVDTDFTGEKLTFDSRGLADGSGDITLKNKRGETREIEVTITGMSRMKALS